jgi:hypothetical protein
VGSLPVSLPVGSLPVGSLPVGSLSMGGMFWFGAEPESPGILKVFQLFSRY